MHLGWQPCIWKAGSHAFAPRQLKKTGDKQKTLETAFSPFWASVVAAWAVVIVVALLVSASICLGGALAP